MAFSKHHVFMCLNKREAPENCCACHNSEAMRSYAKKRIKELKPYQINAAAMAATGNPDTKFMHCLPAFHNTETKVGKEMLEEYGVTEM